MAYRTGADAVMATAGRPINGTGGTVAVPPASPSRPRRPARPYYPDDEDPNGIGLGAGSSAQPMPGQGPSGMEPVRIDPFSDVNYQSLVSALQRGEQEAQNDAAFQTGQIDNELTQALANLQRQYTAQRGNLTTDTRVRGAYDSSQRAALTGRLYEGEQRDSTGARSGAAGRKAGIQGALARLAADYAAQKSRGALDAAGRLQAAEDARLAREQQRMYADQMSSAMAQQQQQLLNAIAALMGGGAPVGDGSGTSAPTGNTTPSWRPGDPVWRPVPTAIADGEPVFTNGVILNNRR